METPVPSSPLSRNVTEVGELAPRSIPTFEECWTGSEKCTHEVTHQSHTMQVPYRRVHLSNGAHLDLADTSGPQGYDPRNGIPPLRQDWI